jgi:hypothetical protein
MSKLFTQRELNRIVAARAKKEQERLAKKFDHSMKKCLASLHLTITQEMAAMKRSLMDETLDPLAGSGKTTKEGEQ